MPLIGNPTAAVLYPGKIVFAVLPYKWAARIYIVAHSVLAFVAMLALMRSWGVGWAGSGVSCAELHLRRTDSVSVLQYHLSGRRRLAPSGHARRRPLGQAGPSLGNLRTGTCAGTTGAWWRPAVGSAARNRGAGLRNCACRSAQLRSRRSPLLEDEKTGATGRSRVARTVAIGVVLVAMWFFWTIVLAILFPKLRPAHEVGKPTPALPWIENMNVAVGVVWLAIAGMCVYRWRGRPWRSPLGAMGLGLVISAALATAATAAQLFPVIEFTQQTTRESEGGTHELYAFSVEPHRLIEMIWPNIWGMQFGGNTYWASLVRLPGSYPKMWVPSLYLGGLTLIFVLPAFALRRGPPWRVWLSYIAIVSILGGLASTQARSG